MTIISNKSNKDFFVTKNRTDQLTFESYLCPDSELSLTATFDCGQCFRWRRENADSDSDSFVPSQRRRDKVKRNNCNDNCDSDSIGNKISYNGIVCGLPIRVYSDGVSVRAKGYGTIDFWRNYFDLERDYKSILSQFGDHPFTAAAIKFGCGLRVLKQDAWEMLVSYIISQNNNIPRISSSISKICAMCGERIEFDGLEFYSFPSAEKILKLNESELRQAGLGYRTDYLISVSQAAAEGKINLDEIKKLPTDEAREILLQLRGVGPKVANCVLLFGLGKLDAFPIDTWINKAAKYYGNNLDATRFGKYAGIAQEYIFYYIRNL
ncbi:MAG: hypothetical protein LBE18_03040 [Planctomycetaceae bacterium]|jgi:N-glycosylase/DNA lyase|nr:hypothetical protein [Planctomycetaceae bacterium]